VLGGGSEVGGSQLQDSRIPLRLAAGMSRAAFRMAGNPHPYCRRATADCLRCAISAAGFG
jgi:hypothetical protein